jgi:hypothetical protein
MRSVERDSIQMYTNSGGGGGGDFCDWLEMEEAGIGSEVVFELVLEEGDRKLICYYVACYVSKETYYETYH